MFLYRYVVDGHFTSKQHPYLTTPRLVCGTRLVTGARLLSVQVNQTPGLYAGPGVIRDPASIRSFTVYSLSRLRLGSSLRETADILTGVLRAQIQLRRQHHL